MAFAFSLKYPLVQKVDLPSHSIETCLLMRYPTTYSLQFHIKFNAGRCVGRVNDSFTITRWKKIYSFNSECT